MRNLKGRISMREATLFVVLLVSLHIQKIDMAEIDIISDSQFLTENDTLVSRAGKFELGLFKPGTSKNIYLGIWYKKSLSKPWFGLPTETAHSLVRYRAC